MKPKLKYDECSILLINHYSTLDIKKYSTDLMILLNQLNDETNNIDPVLKVDNPSDTDSITQLSEILACQSFFVLIDNCDNVIAICTVSSHDHQCLYVRNFIVTSMYRGQGIGKQFFKDCLDRFKKEFPMNTRILLNVFANNTAAYNLYKSLGFKNRCTEMYMLT